MPKLLFLLFVAALALASCSPAEQLPYHETFDEPGNWRTEEDADVSGQVRNGVYDLLVTADDAIIWTTAGRISAMASIRWKRRRWRGR
jgi:hypothetical protein